MWQCGVCGTGNPGDGGACAGCGAVRAPQGPSEGWTPATPPPGAEGSSGAQHGGAHHGGAQHGGAQYAGALPADPPVAWPASAPADEFGSWSPSGVNGDQSGLGANLPAGAYTAAQTPPPPAPPLTALPAPLPPVPPAHPSWAPAPSARPAQHHQVPPQTSPPAVEAAPWDQFPQPAVEPAPWDQFPQQPAVEPAPWNQAAQPSAEAGWSQNPQSAQSPQSTQAAWPAAPAGSVGPVTIIEPESGRRPVWIFPAIVAAVLLLAGGTIAYVLVSRDQTPSNPIAGPTTAAPTSEAAPTPTTQPTTAAPATTQANPTATATTLPAAVGSVRLDPSLDPAQAPAVATIFDRYFTAVNARNGPAALAVLDPGGSIDQSDQAAVNRFVQGISTSSDDDVVLLALSPDTSGKGLLQARVTFRSHQDAGKGPKGRESETCTRWDVTYVITRPNNGEYRIWGSTNAGNRPC